MICFLTSSISGIGFIILYMISVSPEKLSRKIGYDAYKLCGCFRAIAILMYLISYLTFVLYPFFPVSEDFNQSLPWNNFISMVISIASGIVALILVILGMKDSGAEAIAPDKSSKLYQGIYNYMRHPQIMAELIWWFTTALFLHSLPLFIASFFWIIPFITFAFIEDQDLQLRYGDTFIQYKQRVAPFFPNFGRK
ncbi:MAG: DUF1295 domain-containing protein [Spirochaetales bacterium]|nr:DUF1295 domain-containing protein [Spirochaetales bacterium]